MSTDEDAPGPQIFRPGCSICGQACASIEIVPPHQMPLDWKVWSANRQRLFLEYRKADRIYLLYDGPGGGNGWVGDPIDAERASRINEAFVAPSAQRVLAAGFYDGAGFCDSCERFYCFAHWNVSTTGGGTCPQGHFKSLDPHWSPE
jgi:hypothetical protein